MKRCSSNPLGQLANVLACSSACLITFKSPVPSGCLAIFNILSFAFNNLMICAHLKNTFFCLHLFSFFVVVVFFTKLTHTHIHTEPFIYIIYFSCFCTILYGRQLNPSSDLFLSFLCLRKKNLMKGNGTYCTVNLTICQKTHQI